jgi:glycosyltransferase involved in cell wall biosynthesis
MKVALVTHLFDSEIGGGAKESARFLAHGLTQKGCKVVVITTHPKQKTDREHTDGLTIYRLPPGNLYWVGYKDRQPTYKRVLWQLIDTWNPHAFWRVRHILCHERPDIVHVQKLRGLSPSVWTAAAAVDSGPIVQTFHDYELMSPEGTLTSQVGRYAQEKAWFLLPYQRLRAWCSRVVAAATAPSRYTMEMLSSHDFFPKALKQVVPNTHGMMLEQLDELKTAAKTSYISDEKSVRMLYLGRLEKYKGIDLLCEALEHCVARFPNVRLDIAGWGTLDTPLRQRYGRHSNIIFHEPVYGKNKINLLSTSDVLIVPSVWPEVFGIVIAEAYAFGKPVIAARAGGIPELVKEGETGFLLAPGDKKGLIEVLCRVAEDPSKLRKMAPACFEAARQYAVETITDRYLAVYKTVRR